MSFRDLLETLDNMGVLDASEIMEEYEREQKVGMIYIDKEKCEIKGSTPMILTLFCKLCETIVEEVKDVDKEKLQEAFDLAFKSEEEINKLNLNKMKDLLEKLKEELEKEEK